MEFKTIDRFPRLKCHNESFQSQDSAKSHRFHSPRGKQKRNEQRKKQLLTAEL